jgi:4-amino-4-deoxy-L-arabinose transferase-like glycosyltransferase
MASAEADSTRRSRGWLRIAIFLSLLLAFATMLAAASGDLWLDEIWSVRMSRTLHSAMDVFTRRHDNNHPLNTLYLYLLGEPRLQLQYRLASVFGGLGCIGLVAYSAWRRWGPREALMSTVLCASSFPILLYSSEARGYGLLMLFVLAAYVAWSREMQRSQWPTRLAYWIACVLGLLAQFTFVIALFAFGVGQFAADGEARSTRHRLAKLAWLQLVPLLFAAWWYWFFVSRLVVGSGDQTGTWSLVGEVAALLLGLQDTPLLKLVSVLAVLAVVAAGAQQLRKAGDRQWLFFACIIVVAPAQLLLASSGRIVQVRYLLACFPFFFMLASRLLVLGWDRWGRGGRALLALVFVLCVSGNLQRDAFLLKYGRGGYSKAIAHMLQETPTGPVLVGSDHDFRNGMLLVFHAARLPGGERVHYVKIARAQQLKPEWFLLHNRELRHAPPPQFSLDGVVFYRLDQRYGYAGLSGWNWYLYRRMP